MNGSRSMRRPVCGFGLGRCLGQARRSKLVRDEAFSLLGGLFWLWRRRVGRKDVES